MQRADNEIKGKMDCMDEGNKIKTCMELDGMWGGDIRQHQLMLVGRGKSGGLEKRKSRG
jgi:hypothetical protein